MWPRTTYGAPCRACWLVRALIAASVPRSPATPIQIRPTATIALSMTTRGVTRLPKWPTCWASKGRRRRGKPMHPKPLVNALVNAERDAGDLSRVLMPRSEGKYDTYSVSSAGLRFFQPCAQRRVGALHRLGGGEQAAQGVVVHVGE